MAKESKITRTIQTTEATILCLNIETAEPENKTIVLPRTYKNERDIIRAAEKQNTDSNLRLVHVVDVELHSQLYGMPESLFLKYAEPITKAEAEEAQTTEEIQ